VAYSSDTDSDEPNDRTPLVAPGINNSNSLGVGTFRSFRVSNNDFYVDVQCFTSVVTGKNVYSW